MVDLHKIDHKGGETVAMIQPGWGERQWLIGKGMKNLNNICFMSATLQALFHLPCFAKWMIDFDCNTHAVCNKYGKALIFFLHLKFNKIKCLSE